MKIYLLTENVTPKIIANIIHNNESNTLDNLLIQIVLTPLVLKAKNNDILELLDFKVLVSELEIKWDLINRLFPRLLHKINGINALHKEANYYLPLSRKIRFMKYAARVIGYNPLLQECIFKDLLDNHLHKVIFEINDKFYIDEAKFKVLLINLGYSYLVEYLDYSILNPNNLFNLFKIYAYNYSTSKNARLYKHMEG